MRRCFLVCEILFQAFGGWKEKESFILGYFSRATHTLPIRLPARFVLLSSQVSASFPGFAANFQRNPPGHGAELLIQPFRTVPHLGRWLVLFQLPPNKGGLRFFLISSGRGTASEPVWSGRGQASGLQAAPSPVPPHNASAALGSTRARRDAPLVLLRFWPGGMSHSRAKRPICHLLHPDRASDWQLSNQFFSETGAYMFRPRLCTETFSFQTREQFALLVGRSTWIRLIFQTNADTNLMAMDGKKCS